VRSVLPVLLLIAACEARLEGPGTLDREGLGPDAAVVTQGPDAAIAQPDAAPAVAADNACGVASTQGNLGTLMGQSSVAQQGTTTSMIYSVGADSPLTANQMARDVIYVELWDGFGAFAAGPARTGTFTISGDETDYDTCGVCVLVLANYANNTAAKMLAATSGTVTVTSIGTAAGQTTAVTLTNISFTEIALQADQTYQAVAGSTCTSPISNAALSGTL
jgi:hypothetical protein